MLTLLLLAALPDAPLARAVLTPQAGLPHPVLAAAPTGTPAPLAEARKLVDQLRYEEAVVEFQRYLAIVERPVRERALALLELGFVHLVLGDDANAEARALDALELDSKLSVPSSAPPKQVEFVTRIRRQYLARARIELEPRRAEDAPALVRVTVADPDQKVKRVLLRHALAALGPFYAVEMECDGELCVAHIPPPRETSSYTAWYFVEALDATRATVAKVGGPDAALQLAVVDQRPWYTSPVTWGVAGAVLVGVASVVYLLAPQPPK